MTANDVGRYEEVKRAKASYSERRSMITSIRTWSSIFFMFADTDNIFMAEHSSDDAESRKISMQCQSVENSDAAVRSDLLNWVIDQRSRRAQKS